MWEKGETKVKGPDQHLGNWSCLQSSQELDDKIKPTHVCPSVKLQPAGGFRNGAPELRGNTHATPQHTYYIVFVYVIQEIKWKQCPQSSFLVLYVQWFPAAWAQELS